MSAFARVLCASAALTCIAAPSATPASSPATRQAVVDYHSTEQLAALVRSGARIVRKLPALNSAVVETSRQLAGPEPVLRRALTVDEPALAQTYQPGIAWEWQWDAARLQEVPDPVVNGVGISGFGGDAKLLVVQAIDADGSITDVDESAPRSLSSPCPRASTPSSSSRR